MKNYKQQNKINKNEPFIINKLTWSLTIHEFQIHCHLNEKTSEIEKGFQTQLA